MTIRELNRNQYDIKHGANRFIASHIGNRWELYDQAQGYMTVHRSKAGATLDDVQAWIWREYPDGA